MEDIFEIVADIGEALFEASLLEKLLIWYRAVVAFLIIIPLMYIVGFICGLIFFKNPHKCGKGVIQGSFL